MKKNDLFEQEEDINLNKYKDEINFIKYKIYNAKDYVGLEEIKEYLEINFIKDYIWQKEPFNLKLNDNGNNNYYYYGNSKFEESIDDEWFIVYILIELSCKFNQLVITIQDNDGEFLLIETANSLPRWIKPTNSKNRVYIKNGLLHLIPLPSDPSQLDIIPYKMDIQSALSILNNTTSNIKTTTSNEINECIKNRLKRFYNGDYFKEDQNQIKLVYLPIETAYLLSQYPQLISDLVSTFYNRDSDDMKSVSIMNRFKMTRDTIGTDHEGTTMIYTHIRFTRCLYAMLKLQQWNTPRNYYPPLPKLSHPTYDSKLLGVKIICALEMLYNRSLNNELYFNGSDKNWLIYLQQLKQNNYFNDEKQGSKLYKEKLKAAQNQFNGINKSTTNNSNNNNESSIYKLIDQVLKSKPRVEMMEIIKNADNGKIESDDYWLNEDNLDKFEDLIQEFEKDQSKNSKSGSNKSNSGKKNQEDDDLVDNFSNQFKSMLSKLSSIDGIDFKESSNTSGKKKNTSRSGGVDDISFDSNKFMNLLKNLAGDSNMGNGSDSDSDSEDDEMYQDIGDYDSDKEDGSNGDTEDDEISEDEDEEDEEENQNNEFDYVEFLKKSSIKQYMKVMDNELNSKTAGGSSFELETTSIPTTEDSTSVENNNNNEIETETPKKVDLNLNLVKNLLESLSEQQGLAGPASNLLKEMNEKKKKKSSSSKKSENKKK